MTKLINAFEEAREVLFDKKRKSIIRILYELIDYGIRNKEVPRYYSRNMLHRKGAVNYLDYYIGKKDFHKIRSVVRDKEIISFLDNKILFHHHFKESNIKMPNSLGYNIGKSFFSQYGHRSIHNLNSFRSLLEYMISRIKTNSLFIKPIAGLGGMDCFKIDDEVLNSDYLAEVYDKISSSKYLFQETIVQHPLISAIYSIQRKYLAEFIRVFIRMVKLI